MVTNFTAALLALTLVALQLYFIGMYGSGAGDNSKATENPAYFEVDSNLLNGNLVAEDDDFVLSYDLSSSPAMLTIETGMK